MKKSKDIVFLCQFFYPEFVSSSLLPYQTAKRLVEEGLSVDVYCGYPKEYTHENRKIKKKEIVDGINIYRKKYIQLGRNGFLSRLINYFSFTFVILLNLLKFRKYKIMYVYSNPPILPIVAILTNILFKTKIVFVAYDLYPEIGQRTGVIGNTGIIVWTMQFINRLLFSKATRVIALSQDMKEFIIKNRNISSDSVVVIPNWATENYNYKKTKINSDFQEIRQNYSVIVSYFGNMGTAQDLETLMNVVADKNMQNAPVAFLFAGHGNKKEKISAFISENKLHNAYIFDYLNGDDFNDALFISDLFVVSLEKGVSGLAVPSKTYSYYQAEKPVVSIMGLDTDIAKEISKYQAGIAVNNGDSDRLTEFIISLVNQSSKINSLKENVKKLFINNYQKDKQLEKYVKLTKEILLEAQRNVRK